MKKYIEKEGRHWVTLDFINEMKAKMGSLVKRLPEGSYHVYPDMTGSHELYFISHKPIKEIADEKVWEIVCHPDFHQQMRSFVEIVLRKEKMTRQRLVSEVDFSIWNKPKAASKAPSGQYGYTKAIEAMCVGANKRIQKKASVIIRKAARRDEKVLEFLHVHGKRAKSLPAKILIGAFRASIPKLASKIACEGGVCSCGGTCNNEKDDFIDFMKEVGEDELYAAQHNQGEFDKFAGASREQTKLKLKQMFDKYGGRIQKATLKKEIDKLQRELGLSHPREIQELIAQLTREGVLTEGGGNVMWVRGKYAGASRSYGMYGFSDKTASLGLQVCNEIRMVAGHIASDLHMRKADMYGSITGFLTEHGKTTRCASSRLLLSVYPEQTMFKTASPPSLSLDEWLSFEP